VHHLFLAAAASAAAGLSLPEPLPEHRVRLDHPSGAADVGYRGDVRVVHRQTGSAGPGGRASTLRCRWRADMTVSRTMRRDAGPVSARVVDTGTAMEGSRPGWCMTHRAAVARDVAAARGRLIERLAAVAAADRSALLAELDRAPGAPVTG